MVPSDRGEELAPLPDGDHHALDQPGEQVLRRARRVPRVRTLELSLERFDERLREPGPKVGGEHHLTQKVVAQP